MQLQSSSAGASQTFYGEVKILFKFINRWGGVGWGGVGWGGVGWGGGGGGGGGGVGDVSVTFVVVRVQ